MAQAPCNQTGTAHSSGKGPDLEAAVLEAFERAFKAGRLACKLFASCGEGMTCSFIIKNFEVIDTGYDPDADEADRWTAEVRLGGQCECH